VAVLLLIAAAGCALASVASASDARGAFPLRLVNGTHGRWSDRQIYVTVLGIGSSGRWSYLRPDGTMAPLDHTMASAPGISRRMVIRIRTCRSRWLGRGP
jgi:hypothetical protein